MSQTVEFSVRVDGGDLRTIRVATGVYRDAAAAVPAILGVSLPITVDIWCEHLLPKCGPYRYLLFEDSCGGLQTRPLTPVPPRRLNQPRRAHRIALRTAAQSHAAGPPHQRPRTASRGASEAAGAGGGSPGRSRAGASKAH